MSELSSLTGGPDLKFVEYSRSGWSGTVHEIARCAILPQVTTTTTTTTTPPPGRPFNGFDIERETYKHLKQKLLNDANGKFVVVVASRCIGPFDTFERAELTGYLFFGLGPLHIKRIVEREDVIGISRDVITCPS